MSSVAAKWFESEDAQARACRVAYGVEDAAGMAEELDARTWLVRALAAVDDDEDAIPDVSAALAALQVEAGELPPDEHPAFHDGSFVQRECTCPPDLRARDGFRGSCPAHGVGL